MFKRLFKLIEKQEETEEKQNEIIKKQTKEIVQLRITLSNIKVITELNRAGMADLYLNKINELVDEVENHN